MAEEIFLDPQIFENCLDDDFAMRKFREFSADVDAGQGRIHLILGQFLLFDPLLHIARYSRNTACDDRFVNIIQRNVELIQRCDVGYPRPHCAGTDNTY